MLFCIADFSFEPQGKIPLTFSITLGILWGMLSHTTLYVLAGRRKEVQPIMYVLAVVAAALLVLDYGKWS